jgi:hypothetical protein
MEHQSAMEKIQEPKHCNELLRFLGVLNFFGKFIEDGARRMAPLYDRSSWKKKKKK